MQPSAIFCRAQEDIQLHRAANDPLANVRSIASAAAAVWRAEAILAEGRESRAAARSAGPPTPAPAGTTAEAERTFSENPDRGHAGGFLRANEGG